ncbi:MAG: hypothetical protein FWD92_00530 [Methanomassiliicoccaceae archaeon]|nr:hypothetical protein [Methanomassiliicoccaceae archaeon]
MTKNENEETINDLFAENQDVPPELQLWEKNPKRTHLIRDIWFNQMNEQVDEENEMPEEAKRELLFMMAVNSVLDIVMESLPEDRAVSFSYFLDHMLGLTAANQRYGVDLLETSYEIVAKVYREDYDTDEEFEEAVMEKEEKWWTVGKQQLGGRSPNDVIAEALSRYGLNR